MITSKRLFALGGIVAVAGCSGGSTAAAPPRADINATNHVLSTATLTINPTLLKHAASARRRPAFVDEGGSGQLSLEIISQSLDPFTNKNLTPPIVTMQLSTASPAPITVPAALYGPSGTIQVTELLQNGIATIEIASTGNLTYVFPVFPTAATVTLDASDLFGNINNTTGLTLNARIGGIVLSDTPDGSSANTHFFQQGFPGFSFSPGGAFVYAFPADANGGFTNVAVAGGFPNAVQLTSSGGLKPTNVGGVFAVCTIGATAPATATVSFSARDAFGTTGAVGVNISGYLGSC